MTKVFVQIKEKKIKKIELKGHAFYADYGEDIVCAAISMICLTIGNKLIIEEEKNIIIEQKEGYFSIEVKEINDLNNILLSTLELGLKMVEDQYKKFISIKEVQYV